MSSNVELLGSLPYREMFEAIRPCLAGLILFQPGRTNDYTGQPNKLFEFMGTGLALDRERLPGDRAGRCARRDCGWLVDPQERAGNHRGHPVRLSQTRPQPRKGAAGRKAVLDRFHWGIAEQALLGLYRELAP